MGLRSFIFKRTITAFIILLMAISFNFYLFIVMPGNPVELFIPSRGITKEQYDQYVAAFKRAWGLDKPLYEQYFIYLKRMFTWEFGYSIINKRDVADEIMYRLPWTILLMGGSAVIAIVVGVIIGVFAAYKRGSKFDISMLIISLITNSLPVFWLGMVFIVIFAGALKLFPTSHAYPPNWGVLEPWPQPFTIKTVQTGLSVTTTLVVNPSDTVTWIVGHFRHLFLPLLTLSIFQFGGFVLLTRATMLESLTEDYIVTARAKGLPERSVLFRHALKNASLPIITSVAITFGFMLSGAMITETVFTWPGLGHWIYRAVVLKDYFSMQAIFYIITLCVIVANIIADLIYGIIDPRIKYG